MVITTLLTAYGRKGKKMFELTYNQAIEIQEKQIAHYYRDGQGPLTTAGIAKLKERTLPCPFDPNELRPVREINILVPRGGDIESIMGISQQLY